MRQKKIFVILCYVLLISSYFIINLITYFISLKSGDQGISITLFNGGNDSFFYWQQAQNILNGQDWIKTSIYPYMVAFFIRIFHINDPFIPRIANILAFSGLVYTMLKIANFYARSSKLSETSFLKTEVTIMTTLFFYLSLQMNTNIGLFRDIWIYFLYMLTMYLAIKIIIGGEKGLLQYILFTVSVVLLFGLRDYAIISVLGSILIYQILYKKSNYLRFTKKGLFFFMLVFAAYYTFFKDFVVPIVNLSLVNVLEFRHMGIELFGGGSQMMISLNQSNFVSFLFYYFLSFIGNLFGPLPWHIKGFSTLIVFLFESIPFLGMIIYIIRNKKYVDTQLSFLVINALFWNILISLFNDNIGTATRLRVISWLLFLIIFSIICAKKGEQRLISKEVK